MHSRVGPYRPEDVKVVAAFDIDRRKVGQPLEKAVFAQPNCTTIFHADLPDYGVTVQMGPVLDGVADHMADYPDDRAFRTADEDRQEAEFARLELNFLDLWGRRLQLIDCQNLFCEIDKYTRVSNPELQGKSGRIRIKHRFAPHSDPIQLWYPPAWAITELTPGAQLHARARIERG